MTDSVKKVFKAPFGILKRVKVWIFVLIDLLEALLDYWFGPHGARSTPAKRLQSIGPDSGEKTDNETPERIALFISYSRSLTHSNRAYLEALNNAGFAVVYINNARTEPQSYEAIRSLTWRAFDRHNIGRDFCAFKDGVLLLLAEGHLQSCKLLCIANDSMQFIPGRNSDYLVSALNQFAKSTRLALFSHISHQIQTHYQSYFQVLKPDVFLSKDFIKFWASYLPISHRRHCIYNGEIALSQRVYRRFTAVETLFTSDKLQEALEQAYNEAGGVPAEEILRLMPSPARTSQAEKVGYSLGQLLQKSDQNEKLSRVQLYSLPDLIENGNPSHIAAFLYPIYLNCPFIKHDLCTAGSYTIAQAIGLFQEALERSATDEGPELITALVEEYRDLIYSRGVPLSYANRLREATAKGITSGFIYPSTFQ